MTISQFFGAVGVVLTAYLSSAASRVEAYDFNDIASGAELLRSCRIDQLSLDLERNEQSLVNKTFSAVACRHFVYGAVSTYMRWYYVNNPSAVQAGEKHGRAENFCLPADSYWDQWRLVLVRYMTNNSDLLHYPPTVLIELAFADAFPCTSPSTQ